MTTEDDWEIMKPDGTIKRYPIPGGWIYGVWEYAVRHHNSGQVEEYWTLKSTVFVSQAPKVYDGGMTSV